MMSMFKKLFQGKFCFVVLFFMVIGLAKLFSAIPQQINYQGRLLDSGNPKNGMVSMTFSFYNDPTSTLEGNKIGTYTETHNVNVSSGIFSVNIGSITAIPASIFNGTTVYINVHIGSDDLTPRPRVTSSGYAYNAEKLGGYEYAAFVDTFTTTTQTIAGPKTFTKQVTISTTIYISDKVGIGTANHNAKLSVQGQGTSYSLFVSTDSNGSSGNLVIGNDGKVGFGCTPTVHFEVNPNVGNSVTTAKMCNTDNGSSVVSRLVLGYGAGAGGLGKTYLSLARSGDKEWIMGLSGSTPNILHFSYDAYPGDGDKMVIDGNTGNVGIGTSSPDVALDVNGYTQLGSDAPKIKMVYLSTYTYGSTTGGSTYIAHGINSAKVISAQVLVDTSGSGTSWNCPTAYTTGYKFSYNINDTNVYIYLENGGSNMILNKKAVITLLYTE